MSLYRKYRPATLEQLKGNHEIVSALETMMSDFTTCPRSFLIHGPTGCGKTTIARIIVNKLGSIGSDFREVDSADFRGIDTIREIRRSSQFTPMESDFRVWLIDECHKLTNDAQNALLKILEEPPSHVFFILCTTEPHKLIDTIRGRCIQFQVSPLTEIQTMGLLRGIARKEEKSVKKEILEQIALDSMGHPRNAINILEQVLNVPEDQQLDIAKQIAIQQSEMIELCRALLNKATWKIVKEILSGMKEQEPESIRRVILGYAQSVLLKGENNRAALIIEEFMEPTYNIGFPGVVYACYSITKN